VLPLKAHDPLGQDMSIYSTLGCSVFNQLINSNNKNNNTFSHKAMQQVVQGIFYVQSQSEHGSK